MTFIELGAFMGRRNPDLDDSIFIALLEQAWSEIKDEVQQDEELQQHERIRERTSCVR